MRQWEIYLFPFPNPEQPHHFVIISNNGVCGNEMVKAVNGLYCQTVRPATRPPKNDEVYLDQGDGLELKTLVKCGFVHVLAKDQIMEKRGEVSPARVAQIR